MSAEKLLEAIERHAKLAGTRKLIGISVVAPDTELPDQKTREWMDSQYKAIERYLGSIYFIFYPSNGLLGGLRNLGVKVMNYYTANLMPQDHAIRRGLQTTVLEALKESQENEVTYFRRTNLRYASDWNPDDVNRQLSELGLPTTPEEAIRSQRSSLKPTGTTRF